ncbi:MAG: hypothetical protein HC838_07490 [Spirulinaceae cyanobacterium RM2_2_10]|nr:hypothetical protein [Spirulinaceae cyanobacterium RM2_2_10]
MRLGKYALLMLLSERWVYRLFAGLCAACRANPDRLINQSVRGFGEADFFRKIRQQPSAALLALLERRLQRFDRDRITQRIQRAEQLMARLPGLQRPGTQAIEHSHWVFPIQHEQPKWLRQFLWRQGFDATQGGSSLFAVVPPTTRPETRPRQAEQALPQLLYLPLHAGMSSADIEDLAQALEPIFPEKNHRASLPV